MSQFTSSGALDPIEPLTEDEMCTMPLSIHADSDDWPAPVEALARAVGSRGAPAAPPALAELTTLRVGGPVGRFAGIVTIGCQVRDNKLLRTFW